ncbi:acyltransferase family protein [Pseudomonas sp. GL-B-19]|uniref:acyltransferase family protein n=1 Tax=Pseudomonas sp. GL-B-19 TaxID=2832393 RepID=UPI001CBFA291|nr:acyltransferase [Pseudomonas sp. GL-B-19]
MQKNIDIEALRTYAVGMTVIAHLGELIPAWTSSLSVFWLGSGVDLFFCISGFLICQILLQQRDSTFGDVAKVFWVKRVSRLWPAAMFWSVFSLWCAFFFKDGVFGSFNDSLTNALFSMLQFENGYLVGCVYFQWLPCAISPNYWVYWSLSLEEQFYFVFPFLLFFVRMRYLVPALLIMVLLQLAIVRPWGTPLWFFRTDALLLGVLLAVLKQNVYLKNIRLFDNNNVIRVACVVSLLAATVLLARRDWFSLFHSYVVLAAFALVVLASFNKNYIVSSERGRRVSCFFGARSYSIYLIHTIAYYLTREIFIRLGAGGEPTQVHIALMLIVAAVLLGLMVEFSYRLVEQPCRLYGRNLVASYREE